MQSSRNCVVSALLIALNSMLGCSGAESRAPSSQTPTLTGGTGPRGGSSTGGEPSTSGGTSIVSGTPSTGGRAVSSGGGLATGGKAASGGATAVGGASSIALCNSTSLVWKSANKTNYTSYPDPGSEECIKYNGCAWAGQFAACNGTKSEAWVAAHDIVSAFPDFTALKLHDLCLRKGQKLIVVTVLDTCADSDCSGCCTQNKGSADQLIDIESYTNTRWGVTDGPIEWADLGPTKGQGCN